MLWALHHGKRVVNGHGGFALATWNELVTAAESRDPERVASSIRSIYPVRYVVTHPHLLGPVWFPVWQLMQQGAVAPLRHIQTFGADEVYEVMATPEVGTEIRRYFASDLVRRLPVAAYTLRLSGEDPEIHRRVTVHFNGRLLSTHEGPARTRAPLAPPFPRADRNELVFRHVYDVRAAVARGDGYRIGRTTVHSPVDIEVQSAGKAFGDVASIRVNGHEFVPAPRRGYWVAALAPADGRVLSVEKFDTHRSVGESEGFARHLANLGPGTIVVVTAMDETAWQLTEAAVRALRVVGGHGDLRGTFGLSHLVVGVRGAAPGEAVELWGPQFLRAVVGRRRPVGLLLEAFDLVRDGPAKNRP
jgi:Interleukin-like EMT inducer